MKNLKVVFMGTPEYCLPVLNALIENTNVIGVVTQPDKLVGRKKILTYSPAKELAIKHNIPVLQPVRLRKEFNEIIDLKPDIIITCAYGQIIPEEVIYAPKYNTINVHGSILPKYRGGAPIEHAIKNGDLKTGITLMYTDKGMDSGDIIKIAEIDILLSDNLDTVKEKMSKLGAKFLMENLPEIISGSAPRIKQKEEDITFSPIIKRKDEFISFNKTSLEIYNHIRSLAMNPGAFAILDNEEIKIFDSRIGTGKGELGKIINIYKDGLGVGTKDGEIIITKMQLAGKKIMLARDYLNGIDKQKLIGKEFTNEGEEKND